MVSTRSRQSKENNEEDDTTTASNEELQATTSSDADSRSITGSSTEDDYSEEEFEIDEEIWDNPELRAKVEKIIEYIMKNTPSMEDILKTPMRLRHKVKIFELRLIYEQTIPMTEERMALRSQLQRMFTLYKRDYKQFKKRKEEIILFEKDARNHVEYTTLQHAIFNLPAPQEIKTIIYRKFTELRESLEPDYKLKTWIREVLKLPFDRIKSFPPEEMNERLAFTRAYLDKQLYGMEKVKEQLLLFLHTKLVNPESKGCCLGLIGPPGVGKTSIAKCLAKSMDLPFEQVSFGGAGNSDFIKGHDFTYVGSKPGEIARCLSRMEYKNGILFFDEYEKISQNKDIISCLLHITDFSQNFEFRDNYFSEIPIDLSSLWFIYSMNEIPEDPALRDRIYFVKVDGYSEKEKIEIVRDYLIPKILVSLHIPKESITVQDDVIRFMLSRCRSNKGIRDIERLVRNILTKITFLVAHKSIKVSFQIPNLEYPVAITQQMVDILSKDEMNQNEAYLSMYT